MKPTVLPPRAIALALCLAMGLPNSLAFALRVPNPIEAGLEEEISEALKRPSSLPNHWTGLEEPRPAAGLEEFSIVRNLESALAALESVEKTHVLPNPGPSSADLALKVRSLKESMVKFRISFGEEIQNFVRYLGSKNRPMTKIQRAARKGMARILKIPEDHVAFLSLDEIEAWLILHYDRIRVDRDDPKGELRLRVDPPGGVHVTYSDKQGRFVGMIVLRNDLSDGGALLMLSHEAAHHQQDVAARRLYRQSPFYRIVIEGLQDEPEHHLLEELLKDQDLAPLLPKPLAQFLQERISGRFSFLLYLQETVFVEDLRKEVGSDEPLLALHSRGDPAPLREALGDRFDYLRLFFERWHHVFENPQKDTWPAPYFSQFDLATQMILKNPAYPQEAPRLLWALDLLEKGGIWRLQPRSTSQVVSLIQEYVRNSQMSEATFLSHLAQIVPKVSAAGLEEDANWEWSVFGEWLSEEDKKALGALVSPLPPSLRPDMAKAIQETYRSFERKVPTGVTPPADAPHRMILWLLSLSDEDKGLLRRLFVELTQEGDFVGELVEASLLPKEKRTDYLQEKLEDSLGLSEEEEKRTWVREVEVPGGTALVYSLRAAVEDPVIQSGVATFADELALALSRQKIPLWLLEFRYGMGSLLLAQTFQEEWKEDPERLVLEVWMVDRQGNDEILLSGLPYRYLREDSRIRPFLTELIRDGFRRMGLSSLAMAWLTTTRPTKISYDEVMESFLRDALSLKRDYDRSKGRVHTAEISPMNREDQGGISRSYDAAVVIEDETGRPAFYSSFDLADRRFQEFKPYPHRVKPQGDKPTAGLEEGVVAKLIQELGSRVAPAVEGAQPLRILVDTNQVGPNPGDSRVLRLAELGIRLKLEGGLPIEVAGLATPEELATGLEQLPDEVSQDLLRSRIFIYQAGDRESHETARMLLRIAFPEFEGLDPITTVDEKTIQWFLAGMEELGVPPESFTPEFREQVRSFLTSRYAA